MMNYEIFKIYSFIENEILQVPINSRKNAYVIYLIE